ncbi:SapC family protein [Shimia ponticola]|uniref:SapC family protein n=1 Tax=Shimia ponticola TaxID=2582893 RepID=UPI00164BE6BB|nr:SapC family protein [Shimia ponticola]
MKKPTVLSARTHRALGWVSPGPEDALTALGSVPVGAHEAYPTAAALPMIVYRPANGTLQLRALLGAAGRARWQSSELAHQPFALRFYPFTVLRGRPDGAPDDQLPEWRLALHDAPDAIRADGHAFFGPDGKLAPATQKIASEFERACADYDRALVLVRQLDHAGLLLPLSELQPQTLLINGKAMRDLSAEALQSLHRTGALRLAHAMEVARVHLRRLDMTPKAGTTATDAEEAEAGGFLDAVLSAMADDDTAAAEPR